MEEKKKSVKEEVEKTMACSAFAEAGEPCPLDEEQKENEKQEGSGCPCRKLWRAVLLLRQVYPAQSVRTNSRAILNSIDKIC